MADSRAHSLKPLRAYATARSDDDSRYAAHVSALNRNVVALAEAQTPWVLPTAVNTKLRDTAQADATPISSCAYKRVCASRERSSTDRRIGAAIRPDARFSSIHSRMRLATSLGAAAATPNPR